CRRKKQRFFPKRWKLLLLWPPFPLIPPASAGCLPVFAGYGREVPAVYSLFPFAPWQFPVRLFPHTPSRFSLFLRRSSPSFPFLFPFPNRRWCSGVPPLCTGQKT